MAKIDELFKIIHNEGASDLHLFAGTPATMRVRGDMVRFGKEPLDDEQLTEMLYEIAPEDKIRTFESSGDVDFGYEVAGLARYRCNYFRQKYGVGAVFREIPSQIATLEQLGMPPVFKELAMLSRGLVLVTGPTGSGKSTTLAAIVDYANAHRKGHIITVEDPIEFVHTGKSCVVNHREINTHTKSFAAALRAALREDPDIILVGEMRDLETTALAIEAANTGHLVFATLHTMGATRTVDRIIDQYPADQQQQIRMSLSESLKAVISQALFRRVDKKGRVAALEVLICSTAAANLIREEKTFQLMSIIQTSRKMGMISLDDAIMELLQRKWISAEEAYEKAFDKKKFVGFLRTPLPDWI